MTFAVVFPMHHYKCININGQHEDFFFKYLKNMWFLDYVRTKGAVYVETSWRSLREKYLLSGFLDLVESQNESERLLRGIVVHTQVRERKIEKRYAGNE